LIELASPEHMKLAYTTGSFQDLGLMRLGTYFEARILRARSFRVKEHAELEAYGPSSYETTANGDRSHEDMGL